MLQSSETLPQLQKSSTWGTFFSFTKYQTLRIPIAKRDLSIQFVIYPFCSDLSHTYGSIDSSTYTNTYVSIVLVARHQAQNASHSKDVLTLVLREKTRKWSPREATLSIFIMIQ